MPWFKSKTIRQIQSYNTMTLKKNQQIGSCMNRIGNWLTGNTMTRRAKRETGNTITRRAKRETGNTMTKKVKWQTNNTMNKGGKWQKYLTMTKKRQILKRPQNYQEIEMTNRQHHDLDTRLKMYRSICNNNFDCKFYQYLGLQYNLHELWNNSLYIKCAKPLFLKKNFIRSA